MRNAFLSLPLLLLAACATSQSPTAAAGPDSPASHSAYGLFLAGEGAMNDGRSHEAGEFFSHVRSGGEDEGLVGERAFTAALLAGEVDKAAALAPDGEQVSEGAKRLALLVKAVKAMADGDGKAAKVLLSGEEIGFPHRPAAALLAPWASAMAGDVDGSVVRPEVRGDKLVDYFGQLGQAYLFERARRYDEAETDFKAVTGSDRPGEMVVLAYGGFLERRARRADAIALYDASLARDPDSQGLKAARERTAANKPAPPAPTLKQGAAQALLAPAATMLAAKQNQLALADLRLALRLDPDRDEAWVMVGDVKADEGDQEAARAAYGMPKPGSLEYPSARAKLAWTYQADKDTATALKLAREGAASGDTDARLTLADLLRVNEQYEESAQIVSALIAQSKSPEWRLLYARGVAYERLDRWPEAERDLEAALKLQPDEPELLNYLGYSWIDRGIRLKEALAMVQKAVAANPKSGAMTDSLGWAYYRLGDYRKAVELLETAVELEAGEPEINDHLGDAYWRVGRRDEARFQWRRVLTLDPEPKIKAGAMAKLEAGLGPTGPASKPKLAGQ
ncbi:tetratricopeptide repeat protein [Phenylobacterium sp.]|jgi:Flp pilus assembly protein TadD|uniref:tetratricopeptide repeat protein n=1 Tax=Phenylobacterium sp. TaxID=1871053 RepID=UPI002F415150